MYIISTPAVSAQNFLKYRLHIGSEVDIESVRKIIKEELK